MEGWWLALIGEVKPTRKHIIFAVFLFSFFGLATNAALSEPNFITTKPALGCLDKEFSKQAITLLYVEKDFTAYERKVELPMLTGECKGFQPGTFVYRSDFDLFGPACVREEGDPRCYWVTPSAIAKVEK